MAAYLDGVVKADRDGYVVVVATDVPSPVFARALAEVRVEWGEVLERSEPDERFEVWGPIATPWGPHCW